MTEFLENRVALAVLKDLKGKIEELHIRINELDNKIENVQEKALKNWLERYQNKGKDIKQFYPDIEFLNSKISDLEEKFEEIMQKKPITQTIQEPLTIVESKRIEKITSLLKRHEKLSSTELSDLIGLSRTRCNEYFKLMEKLEMVKPILVGKEKFYGLKSN